jgi:hypothetical protein
MRDIQHGQRDLVPQALDPRQDVAPSSGIE